MHTYIYIYTYTYIHIDTYEQPEKPGNGIFERGAMSHFDFGNFASDLIGSKWRSCRPHTGQNIRNPSLPRET